MEGIGKGIGEMVFTVVTVLFLIGFSFGSILFSSIGLRKSIESKEKVLYPTDYRIEVNDKKIDTIYIFDKE